MEFKKKRKFKENNKKFLHLMRDVFFYYSKKDLKKFSLTRDLSLRRTIKKSVFVFKERLKFLTPLYKLRIKIREGPPFGFDKIKRRFKKITLFKGAIKKNILLTRDILEKYILVFCPRELKTRLTDFRAYCAWNF